MAETHQNRKSRHGLVAEPPDAVIKKQIKQVLTCSTAFLLTSVFIPRDREPLVKWKN